MPKKFKIHDINLLLLKLSENTGQSLDYYGLDQISAKIDGSITRKYLYYSLVKPIENASKNQIKDLNLAPNKIDEIARFMNFDDFNSFVLHSNKPLNPILQALKGTYYSYVRKNAEPTILLQSPVEILEIENRIMLHLKGPVWTYEGELKHENGCLFCLLKSESGKSIHHVYKIGNSISPSILMGVFSGISSANDPIAGRCVLVRQDSEELKNEIIQITYEEALASQNKRMNKIGIYFKDYEKNNLKIDISKGFDIDDLI